MFSNIGGKIKGLASFICWVGIIISVIGAIVICSLDEELIFVGIIVGVLGSLGSWIGSFLLYGFGQLIYTNERILAKLGTNGSSGTEPMYNDMNEPYVHQRMCDNCKNMIDKEICPYCGKAHGKAAERIESLQNLLKNGTITPEDYDRKLEEIRNE